VAETRCRLWNVWLPWLVLSSLSGPLEGGSGVGEGTLSEEGMTTVRHWRVLTTLRAGAFPAQHPWGLGAPGIGDRKKHVCLGLWSLEKSLSLKKHPHWVPEAYTCNPICSGGGDQEDHSWKPARANSSHDPISKKKTKNKAKPFTKEGWWSGSSCRSCVQTLVTHTHTHTHTNTHTHTHTHKEAPSSCGQNITETT
jgi:hypothetical protein